MDRWISSSVLVGSASGGKLHELAWGRDPRSVDTEVADSSDRCRDHLRLGLRRTRVPRSGVVDAGRADRAAGAGGRRPWPDGEHQGAFRGLLHRDQVGDPAAHRRTSRTPSMPPPGRCWRRRGRAPPAASGSGCWVSGWRVWWTPARWWSSWSWEPTGPGRAGAKPKVRSIGRWPGSERPRSAPRPCSTDPKRVESAAAVGRKWARFPRALVVGADCSYPCVGRRLAAVRCDHQCWWSGAGGGEPMPLSEHEQRMLDEIERALYEDDPKFATSVNVSRIRRRRPIVAGCLFVAGLVALVVGVIATQSFLAVGVVVSVIGFLTMVGAVGLFVFGQPERACREGCREERRQVEPRRWVIGWKSASVAVSTNPTSKPNSDRLTNRGAQASRSEFCPRPPPACISRAISGWMRRRAGMSSAAVTRCATCGPVNARRDRPVPAVSAV